MRRLLTPILLCLLCAVPVSAQQELPQKSLADIAREANKNKAPHAKVVISDDTLAVQKGPLPELNFEGVDNADDISKAMADYRAANGDKKAEDLIHTWYDKYYSIFGSLLEENKKLAARAEERRDYPSEYYNPNRDARQNREMRDTIVRSEHNDYQTFKQNGLKEARIQQAFTKVRNELIRRGLRYDWFKIPQGNGNGSY